MSLTITHIIIILTALVSLGALNSAKVMGDLIFYPPAVSRNNQWYRFFSSGFIHADFTHLIFNMITLYFFGPEVERAFEVFFPDGGKWIYLGMYLSALFVSLYPTYLKHKNNYQYRSLGASGAVSAVLFAGLLLAPGTAVMIFFIPIPIPGFIFAPLYLILSVIMERKGGDNINHSAHIWGAVYGLAFTIVAGFLAGENIITSFIEGVRDYLGR
jgi:membrane associated rhomboid family serine protease